MPEPTIHVLLLLLLLVLLLLHSASSSAEDFRFTLENEDGDVKRYHFPDNFLFRTATFAYQVEGGYLEDGKGLSNWDVFSRIPGKIKNGDTGDVADDHYHLFMEDINLLHSLGVNAYRFSISWSRILPRERLGEVNPTGIKFYNNIIDNLLLRRIEPFVTIYHHDFPQELEDRYGSWLSPVKQEDDVHFSETCFESFGDRIEYWTTLNEPNLLTEVAYIRRTYPPAHCSPPFGNCSVGNSDIEPLVVLHNMLLSHAKAVKLYRERFQPKQGGAIGIITSSHMYEPLTDDELNQQAANRTLAFTTGWMLDPLVFGDYSSELRQYHGSELPRFSAEEVEYVEGSVEFIGINHYSTLYPKDCIYSACTSGGDHAIKGLEQTTGERDNKPTGIERFFVVPRGMEKIVTYVKQRYNNIPMYVTENGYSPWLQQREGKNDLLQDVKRIEFHKSYLAALAGAIRKGADVRGYFIWSLMDNLKWTEGYGVTFGLYHVDRQTVRRTPNLSAKWYKDFLTNSSDHNYIQEFNRETYALLRAKDRESEGESGDARDGDPGGGIDNGSDGFVGSRFAAIDNEVCRRDG
ncbi:hypothetical protein SLE2022_016700 [Rubroshorea leprosula]